MKEKILDAAAKLILQYGLKKFTVDEIASDLKISKKTIYQYFRSKDDIIREYFEVSLSSDRESTASVLSSDDDFFDKIHALVYSNHRYRLPVSLLMEARQFYPEIWSEVEELKQFKMDTMKCLLEQGVEMGIFKQDIHFGILAKLFEKTGDLYTDYDFLMENRLNTREAIDETLKIIFGGILRENKDR